MVGGRATRWSGYPIASIDTDADTDTDPDPDPDPDFDFDFDFDFDDPESSIALLCASAPLREALRMGMGWAGWERDFLFGRPQSAELKTIDPFPGFRDNTDLVMPLAMGWPEGGKL
ncbi:MAG: hypothetical protein PHC78_10115 [Verrucomicrobiota bacterium]|nr:hypothetical protein [Verrucomicrobiota bacterium]